MTRHAGGPRLARFEAGTITLAIGCSVGLGILVASNPKAAAIGVCGLLAVVATGALLSKRQIAFPVRGCWLICLFFISGLDFRARTTGSAAQQALDSAAIFRVAIVALVALSAIALIARPDLRAGELRLGLFAPLLGFSLWGAATALWSVNPAWTLYRVMEYTLGVALFVVIGEQISRMRGELRIAALKRVTMTVWSLYMLLLASAVISALLFPDRGIVPSWGVIPFNVVGVYPLLPENSVGSIAAMLSLVLITRFFGGAQQRRALYSIALAGCLAVLFVSETRSAILGLGAGCIVIVLARRKFAAAAIVGTLLAIMVVALPQTQLDTERYLQRGQTPELLRSLSSRTDYWKSALRVADKHPIEGAGAYAAGRFLVSDNFDPTLSSTHGTWIEVLVDEGIVGVAALALAVVLVGASLMWTLSLSRAWPRAEQWLATEALSIMVFLLVRSVFSVMLFWQPALDFLTVVLIADVLRRFRRQTVGVGNVPL